MIRGSLKFVAWPCKEWCRHFNLLTDRWCECVMDVCEFGVVEEEDECYYHTRRLSDGKKWSCPKSMSIFEKVVESPEELRKFEEEHKIDWWKIIAQVQADERHEHLKKEPCKPSVCPSCKFCFFDKDKDEWACSASSRDLLENSCGSYEKKEEE